MSKKHKNFTIILLVMLFLSIPGYAPGYTIGKVVDFFTQRPIKEAFVTLNNDVLQTDENGMFIVKTMVTKVAVRAYGYMRTEKIITAQLTTTPIEIKLMPFTPKALYLSFFGIGSRSLRESALKLIQETELNALVIDVKGDRGMIIYKSSIPLSMEVGAQRIITVKDIRGLIKSLKEKGIYTIARIVVFKDNLLALAKPELAVKNRRGMIWRDRESLEHSSQRDYCGKAFVSTWYTFYLQRYQFYNPGRTCSPYFRPDFRCLLC